MPVYKNKTKSSLLLPKEPILIEGNKGILQKSDSGTIKIEAGEEITLSEFYRQFGPSGLAVIEEDGAPDSDSRIHRVSVFVGNMVPGVGYAEQSQAATGSTSYGPGYVLPGDSLKAFSFSMPTIPDSVKKVTVDFFYVYGQNNTGNALLSFSYSKFKIGRDQIETGDFEEDVVLSLNSGKRGVNKYTLEIENIDPSYRYIMTVNRFGDNEADTLTQPITFTQADIYYAIAQ
jgi:hypothetical protein